MPEHVIYSFIVDQAPSFGHQGWVLADSLCLHCDADPQDIHVQITPEVSPEIGDVFKRAGYSVHALTRFGDGRGCNKLSQLPNLLDQTFDRVVLLDTDTVAVSDLRTFLKGDALQAKPVDLARPSLAALNEIFRLAGAAPPETILAEAVDQPTALGNANGGFYALPKDLAEPFSAEWRRWASWLMDNDEPLRREGRLVNIDQVSAAMAVQISRIPYRVAPSNLNYFIHFEARHRYFEPTQPIALFHYHHMTMNHLGLLKPVIPVNREEQAAMERANERIKAIRHALLSPSLSS